RLLSIAQNSARRGKFHAAEHPASPSVPANRRNRTWPHVTLAATRGGPMGRMWIFGTLFSIGVRATAPADDARVARGMQVVAEQKCMLCHSIAGKGNTKGPLDNVGGTLSAD